MRTKMAKKDKKKKCPKLQKRAKKQRKKAIFPTVAKMSTTHSSSLGHRVEYSL